ncbi:MAG: FHA domain-containing protein [Thermoanaerobaculum sp.]|nr:FHA domain-containing protein [Thermoanaerobaculum sp.]MDW7966639.1 FHA domain-containing protein [Thermoanaerobaculum sp.]
MSWSLRVGDAEFPLQPPRVVVGRSRSCDVRLREDTVSRLHAAFVWDEGGWLLEDLGSSNGTFLNGQRVVEPQRVKAGDHVRFGSLKGQVAGPGNAASSGSKRPVAPEATWDYTVGLVPATPAGPFHRLAAAGLDALLFSAGSFIPFLPLLTMLAAERWLLRPEILPPGPTTEAFVAGGCGALWVAYAWYYWIHGWARRGGTPGLRLLGLRLVDQLFRQPIGYARAWWRALACLVSLATLGAGWGLAFFRRDCKTLHDLLAGTQVVRRGDQAPPT